MARPTKLTAEVTAEIVRLVEAGNYNETAAEAVGIDRQTFHNWMKWGGAGTDPYAAFFDVVTRARANAEAALLDKVATGDGKGESFGQGKAAAFILERTRPKKFAQRINVKVQDELERLLDIAERVLAPKDFGVLIEALAADGGEGEAGEAEGAELERVH
jgi:hypothetical protein